MVDIVFIHGWSSNKNALNCIKPLCKIKNINFHSFDLPLHGNLKNYSKQTIIDFSFLCRYSLDKIKKIKTDYLILIGHSMGGAIILNIHQQIPSLKKVILINPLVDSIGNEWNYKKIINHEFKDHSNPKKWKELIKKINTYDYGQWLRLTKLLSNFKSDNFSYYFKNLTLNKSISWNLIYGEYDFLIDGDKTAKWIKKLNPKTKVYKMCNERHSPHLKHPILFLEILNEII